MCTLLTIAVFLTSLAVAAPAASLPLATNMADEVEAVWKDHEADVPPRWTLRDIMAAKPETPDVALTSRVPAAVRTGPLGTRRVRQESEAAGDLVVDGRTDLVYEIPEDAERFVAVVGVSTGSLGFTIYGMADLEDSDPAMLERSPTLPAGDLTYWHFNIDLRSGHQALRLSSQSASDDVSSPASGVWMAAGFLRAEEQADE